MKSTCVYMCHLLGSVIFFGGLMAVAIGEDKIIRSTVKSTYAYMCHLLGSVIFLRGQMATSGQLVVTTSVKYVSLLGGTREVGRPVGGS